MRELVGDLGLNVTGPFLYRLDKGCEVVRICHQLQWFHYREVVEFEARDAGALENGVEKRLKCDVVEVR